MWSVFTFGELRSPRYIHWNLITISRKGQYLCIGDKNLILLLFKTAKWWIFFSFFFFFVFMEFKYSLWRDTSTREGETERTATAKFCRMSQHYMKSAVFCGQPGKGSSSSIASASLFYACSSLVRYLYNHRGMVVYSEQWLGLSEVRQEAKTIKWGWRVAP